MSMQSTGGGGGGLSWEKRCFSFGGLQGNNRSEDPDECSQCSSDRSGNTISYLCTRRASEQSNQLQ